MIPHCLDVPEILLTVCEDLANDTQEGKKALVNLSLVTKRFQNAALNVLWKVQTSLIPLLRCFPNKTYEYTREDSTDGSVVEKLTFVRYLREKDWNRVQLSARRVKVLCWTSREASELPPDLWPILFASLPSTMKSLLPELRELRYPDTDVAFYALNLLFSPSVRTFALSLNGSMPLRISCLLALPEKCPSLHTIVISQFTPGCLSGLGPALLKFKSLRNLVVSPAVTRKPMHWFSAYLQSIESLDLHFGIPNNRDFTERPLQQGVFPKLKQATLRDIKLSLVPQLLTPIGSPSLHEIKIHFMKGVSEENWIQALASLRGFRNSLTTLALHERPSFLAMPYPLTHASLVPLCTLSRLQTLQIYTRADLTIGNDFLQTLSAGCPDLRELAIVNNSSHVPTTPPTLCGLLPLLERCPRLVQLSLHINATLTPFVPHPSTQFGVTNTSMHVFRVGYSPILDTVKVAAFLAAVAPNLSKIDCSRGEYAPLWEQTELHLQVARAVRS